MDSDVHALVVEQQGIETVSSISLTVLTYQDLSADDTPLACAEGFEAQLQDQL